MDRPGPSLFIIVTLTSVFGLYVIGIVTGSTTKTLVFSGEVEKEAKVGWSEHLSVRAP